MLVPIQINTLDGKVQAVSMWHPIDGKWVLVTQVIGESHKFYTDGVEVGIPSKDDEYTKALLHLKGDTNSFLSDEELSRIFDGNGEYIHMSDGSDWVYGKESTQLDGNPTTPWDDLKWKIAGHTCEGFIKHLDEVVNPAIPYIDENAMMVGEEKNPIPFLYCPYCGVRLTK